MKYHPKNSMGKNKKEIAILISITVLLILINVSNQSNSIVDSIGEQSNDPISDFDEIDELKIASHVPNGKPLLVTQYANFTESYASPNLPTNVSFTLQQDWTSKNINISFEGVSLKKDRVTNGTFDSLYHGWNYTSNIPIEYVGREGQAPGNPGGSVEVYIDAYNKYLEGDYGYYERNITLQEELSPGKLAVLSFDYYCDDTPENFSAYLAIKVGNSEKNRTWDFPTQIQVGSWQTLTMVYDPNDFSDPILPGGNITVRVGVYSHGQKVITGGERTTFQIDNVKNDLWTMPNQMKLVVIQDVEFSSNHTYVNSSYGRGYYYNATERSYPTNKELIFTISQNITGIDDFDIAIITITANLMKRINSSYNGLDGSLFTPDIPITWDTKLIISIPSDYKNNRAEITKPPDWNVTQILDGYDVNRIQDCTGTNPGSVQLIIPNGVFDEGLWEIYATSSNYISNGSLAVWNGTAYNEESNLTLGNTYRINVGLNHTLVGELADTQINCTIEYPNGTIFYQNTTVPYSTEMNFGTQNVGINMSVGTYQVTLVWTNNQSFSSRDKVGFLQFGFDVWHQTNLTALNPNEVKVSRIP